MLVSIVFPAGLLLSDASSQLLHRLSHARARAGRYPGMHLGGQAMAITRQPEGRRPDVHAPGLSRVRH